MSNFPKMMFRKGGPYKGGYSVGNATDKAEFDEMVRQGWCVTKAAALDDVVEEVKEAQEAVEDIGDELRAALEVEAKELGVKFNSRTSDKKLSERIAEARG